MSPSRRRWFKGVAALLSVVFGMGILELCLRMAGVGYPTTFFVKTRHEGEDYWMENPGFLYRFVPKAQARSPRPVMVPVAKQDHTIRIFVLGESAAMGDPEPAFGMPEILRVLLESRYPQTRFEVVNTALTAINSHLIHHIAAECVQKEADFLVLYMGNNEVTGPMGPGTVFGDTRSDSWMLQLGLQLKKYHLGQAMDALREKLIVECHRAVKTADGNHMFREADICKFRSKLRSKVQIRSSAGPPTVNSGPLWAL